MNEADKEYVRRAKSYLVTPPFGDITKIWVSGLLDIIVRLEADSKLTEKTRDLIYEDLKQLDTENAYLKAQLRAIKEVGEVLVDRCKLHDTERMNISYEVRVAAHCLAAELEGVKDE